MVFKKGYAPTIATKRKISDIKIKLFLNPENHPMYGKHHSKEAKIKMRESKLEKPCWNKGLTKETDERVKRISEANTGEKNHFYKRGDLLKGKNNPHYGKGYLMMGENNHFFGKKHSDETKRKMSQAKKDYVPWHKGKTGVYSEETLQKMRKPKSNETKRKISEANKGHIPWNKGKLNVYSEETINKMIKAQYGSNSLENNPNWRGGISFEPYDKTFNKHFKNLIRNRDNQICMMCGIHREKLRWALDVHHIDYDKLNSIPQNCISLCKGCHTITGYDRESWKQKFQSKLNKSYGYRYENGRVVIDLTEIQEKLVNEKVV